MSWLTGWGKRKSKIVLGTIDGAQAHFQMLTIRMHRATGTDTPSGANDTIQHIHAGLNVRTDFGDVRFTAADGTTLIPYWIQSSTDTFADFVVRVPSIPVSPGQTTIFVYYDKTATSVSNGAATFEFFDDFDGTTLDTARWFVSANSFSVSGSILRINIGGVGLQSALPFNLQTGHIVETRCLFNTLENAYGGTIPQISSSRWTRGANAGADATILYMREHNSRQLAAYIGNGAAASYNVLNNHLLWHSVENVWYITGVSVRGGIVELWRDGTVAHTTTRITWAKTQSFFALGFFTGGAAGNTQNTSYDWIRIRRHTANHPSWGATGVEEVAPAEVVILRTDTITATDIISHIGISQVDTIAATDTISYREIQVADTIIATDHAPRITKGDIVWIYAIDTVSAFDTVSHREIRQIDTIAATDTVALIIPQTDTIVATDVVAHIGILQTDRITATDVAHIQISQTDTIIATDTISGRVIQQADTIVGVDTVSGRVIQIVDTITATDIIASMITVSRDVIIDIGRDSVIKCTVSHNINDATRICTCEIEGSVPLREFEFFTITDRDFAGNPQVIFFGFAVIIRRKTEGGLATMTLHAFDAGYYLTTQKITMSDIRFWSDRTLTFEPTFKIWQMLGGHNWLTTTTINPIWLFPTPHGRPLRQFDFKTTDTLQKVFTELANWYDAVFTLSYNVRAAGQVETRAHFVHRSVIDRDLPLPPQVVFANPNNFKLGYNIETDHERLVNRVRVNGIWAERGEWFFTSRSTTLAAGELIREYVEEFTPQPTPATRADFEAQVTARLNLLFDILTDTRRAQFLTFSVENRPDLRLFQLVSFTGFADIPTFTWRIVEITYNIVAASSMQTVRCVFDTFNNSTLSIPKVREILNAEDSVQHIQNICEREIEKLPEIMVGRVISISADGRHAEIELERGLQRVRVRIV